MRYSTFTCNDLTSSADGDAVSATPINPYHTYTITSGPKKIAWAKNTIDTATQNYISNAYGRWVAFVDGVKVTNFGYSQVRQFAAAKDAVAKVVSELRKLFDDTRIAYEAETDATKKTAILTKAKTDLIAKTGALDAEIVKRTEEINKLLNPTSTGGTTTGGTTTGTPKTLKYGVIGGAVLLAAVVGYIIIRKK